MKMLWKLTKEAARYKYLYALEILSTLGLTIVNLSAPKVLSSMTGHEDILNMPEQYETKVVERGLRLSGGQKQRVAIARAILRQSPIIVLDEATASVDVQTEKQIQKAIKNIAGKRTIVAIAHRLSTIKEADMILVIHEGEIVERGTHEELLTQKGLYYKMQQAQE